MVTKRTSAQVRLVVGTASTLAQERCGLARDVCYRTWRDYQLAGAFWQATPQRLGARR